MKSRSAWSLPFKLYGLIAGAALTVLGLGLIGYYEINQLNGRVRNANEVLLPAMRLSMFADMMHDGLRGVAYRSLYAARAKQTAELEASIAESEEMIGKFQETRRDLEQLDLPAAIRRDFATVAPDIDSYVAATRALVAQAKQTDAAALARAQQEFERAFGQLEASLDKFATGFENHAIAEGRRDTQSARRASVIMGASAALAIGFGLIVGLGITRSLTLLLRRISRQVSENAGSVETTSEQLRRASLQLAESTTSQAASLEETAASLEEVSSMARQSTESAGKARQVATEARQQAEQGVAGIQQMVQTVGSARRSVGELQASVQTLQDSSVAVAKIIKTIDEIAFQTNLLALNAAVEAARAGGAGAGFAVVAEEVRNLAQRSAEAAQDTAARIEAAIAHAGASATATEHVVENLTALETKAADVEQSFSRISSTSAQVEELMSGVDLANREQSSGITQINSAVSQIDRMTQSSAAAAEECSATSNHLRQQSSQLQNSVTELNELIHGTAAAPATPTAPAAATVTTSAPAPARRPSAPPKAATPARPTGTLAVPHPHFRDH